MNAIVRTSKLITAETLDTLAENRVTIFNKDDYKSLSDQVESYLKALEDLARAWNLIKVEKYRHRAKHYGTHDHAINLIPRRTDRHQIFNLKTMLSSCRKPYAVTKRDQKISKVNQEYFHHAAKL